MENLLEKITLYDLLGYMFSGCILNFMILVGIYSQYNDTIERCYENYGGGFLWVFFIFSYLMGILLSEISVSIGDICRKCAKKGQFQWPGWLKRFQSEKSAEGIDGTGISEEELILALMNSGIKEEKEKAAEKIECQGWQLYKKYMYGIIQYDEKYKRIHNYASMVVLCKNAATALMGGIAVLIFCGSRLYILMIAALISAVLLVKRSLRFEKKKDEYTIVWFVNKNMTGGDNSDQGVGYHTNI